MRWQCCFIDAHGVRCAKEAVQRIHFAAEHPIDHTDVCQEHLEEFVWYIWSEELDQSWGLIQ